MRKEPRVRKQRGMSWDHSQSIHVKVPFLWGQIYLRAWLHHRRPQVFPSGYFRETSRSFKELSKPIRTNSYLKQETYLIFKNGNLPSVVCKLAVNNTSAILNLVHFQTLQFHPTTWIKEMKTYWQLYSFCCFSSGATLGDAQDLILALHLGICPGGAQVPYAMPGIKPGRV